MPHPFANILGQEIFEAKLVPSDTDFRIFRDFGKIPGMRTLNFDFTDNDIPLFKQASI